MFLAHVDEELTKWRLAEAMYRIDNIGTLLENKSDSVDMSAIEVKFPKGTALIFRSHMHYSLTSFFFYFFFFFFFLLIECKLFQENKNFT